MNGNEAERFEIGETLITGEGLIYMGRRYACRTALLAGWYERARREGEWRLPLYYSPRTNRLYIRHQGEYVLCRVLADEPVTAERRDAYFVGMRQLKEALRQARAGQSR